MSLNTDNYYSKPSNYKYISVSQYKRFVSTPTRQACECSALAELRGEISFPPTDAMMIGSYVDAYFSGELEKFKDEHPELISSRGETKGQLKKEFQQADAMIARAISDETFMYYMHGETQLILTGEIAGTPWKCKPDVICTHNGKAQAIVDLKCVQNIAKTFYVSDSGERITWIEEFGYALQGAVYQYIYKQNYGVALPFYLAAISKDKDVYGKPHPRLSIIQIPQPVLDAYLVEVEINAPRIQALKTGQEEPIPCQRCDWCADHMPCEVISMDQVPYLA